MDAEALKCCLLAWSVYYRPVGSGVALPIIAVPTSVDVNHGNSQTCLETGIAESCSQLKVLLPSDSSWCQVDKGPLLKLTYRQNTVQVGFFPFSFVPKKAR